MNTLYTTGYLAGWTPQTLLAESERLNAVVVDIRYSPKSRNPAWQKSALRDVFGARYVHLVQFGNVNYKNGGPIKLASPYAGTDTVQHLLADRPVILLCACGIRTTCHRVNAANFIQQLLGCEVEELQVVK